MANAPRTGSLEDLSISIGFTTSRAIVSVTGDIDARTAPPVRQVVAGLVDSGQVAITLDLSGVDFLGAAGLGLIAHAGAALQRAGGILMVRDPQPRARQILALTGVTPRVSVEPPDLREDLAVIASASTAEELADAKMASVVALASISIGGVDGASVCIERQGQLVTVAASNDTVLRMDAHQYATGQGPCLAAAHEGERFEIPELAAEDRWPDFVPLAMDDGIATILSTPLKDSDRSFGAFNLYSSTLGAFGPREHELATVFATYAAELVSHGGDAVSHDHLAARIDVALRSRALLSLAQGVLMARHHVTSDEASAVLHRLARGAGLTTLEQAADIVASTSIEAPTDG